MAAPEGVKTVGVEGADVARAVDAAAVELGVDRARVRYDIDMAHFRNNDGGSVARRTVRVVAWVGEGDAPARPARPAETAPREPRPQADEPRQQEAREERRDDRGDRPERGDRPDRGDRGGRDRQPRGDRDSARAPRPPRPPREPRLAAEGSDGDDSRKPERVRSPAAGVTDASTRAESWFNTLLNHMGIQGTVAGTGEEGRVHLSVAAERAGRLVGKRGATLGAVRHLLALVLQRDFGELVVDVDIADDRPQGERQTQREDREPREAREPRPPRERDSREARPPREENRRDDADGGGAGERGRYAAENLQKLARRAAEKARESGKSITINLELNSYDRRLVHLEIAEIPGVRSQSEEKTIADASGREVVRKFVQVIPE